MNIQNHIKGYDRHPASFRLILLRLLLGVAFVFVALIPAALQGQITAGSINGVVNDSSGAIIPGATVTIVNIATSATRTAVTSQDGRYDFSQLTPGDFVITVSQPGFATYKRTNILLQPSQALELDLQLTVGSVSQQVVVSSAPSLLHTEDANLNVTMDTKELLALPNISHSSLGSVWATGGVTSAHTGMNGGDGGNRFSLDGGRDMGAAILVDGIGVTFGTWAGTMGLPSADMVKTTQVARSTFDAQYGKTDGSVVSVTTRGGSGAFHGSAYEYWKGDALSANSWTNDFNGIAKSHYNINLFGGHLSGPVWRSKHLYFLGNYEENTSSRPSTLVTTVPTQAERQGDFTGDAATDKTFSPIFNPFSTTLSNGTYVRQSFPTPNVIPASLINPVGKTIANLYPLPNRAGVQNYAASATSSSTSRQADVRGDWAPSQKFSMYGTVMDLNSTSVVPVFFGRGLDTGGTSAGPTWRTLLSGTYVPSSTFVVNVTGAAVRWNQANISPGTIAGRVDGTIYGLSQPLVDQFPNQNSPPTVSPSGYQSLANDRTGSTRFYNYDFQVNATKILNTHTIRFGYQMTVQQINETNSYVAGFSFNRGMTSGPVAATNSSTSGDSIASLLLGTMSGSTSTNWLRPAATQKSLAGYAEDAWKATNRLTINYGLRYEIQFGRTERYNRFNHFDPNAVNPLSQQTGLNLKGGLVYADSNHRGVWDTEYKNLAPRIGIAYQVTPRLVFHVGYGIYYLQTVSIDPIINTDGFSASTSGATSVNNAGFIPQDLVSNPFPNGLNQPIGSSQGLLTNVGNTIRAYLLKHPTPYTQTYATDFQLQLPNEAIVSLGYQGSQGRQLPLGYQSDNALNFNQLPTRYLSLGSALNTQVPNPFHGTFPSTSSLSGPTIPANQMLRPYPQFVNVNFTLDQSGASSSYNALLASYSQRMAKDLTLYLHYQWSKAIDNTSATSYNGDAPRDIYNLSLERSVSEHDVPHYFTATVVWDLPFGRGKQFGSEINRITDAFIGGWQVSTITNVNSGFPVQFSCPNALSSYGFTACRPNIPDVKALAPKHKSLGEWFNTSSLVASVPAPYTIGNAPRYLSNVRAGVLERSDLTVRKGFALTGEKIVSVHVTAFNVSNTPYYGAPNASIGSSTYGEVRGTGPGAIARTVELGARLTF